MYPKMVLLKNITQCFICVNTPPLRITYNTIAWRVVYIYLGRNTVIFDDLF